MIHLFVSTYTDKDSARNEELRECLRRNRENPHIKKVHTRESKEKLTYAEFFSWVNQTCRKGEVGIVSNSDIYFDETVSLVQGIQSNQCYALSRWDHWKDYDEDWLRRNPVTLVDIPKGSQDSWVFRTPIRPIADIRNSCRHRDGKPYFVKGGGFPLGVPGCDRRIAFVLKESGYEVINPCQSIITHHLHAQPSRTFGKECVVPPYFFVSPCRLNAVRNVRKV